MYKLIAIDLDGTLLNSYGQVSERNREALKKRTGKRNTNCFSIWKINEFSKKYSK